MGSDSSPLLFKSMKCFLAGVVTTLLWACAITQVLIERSVLPALQPILMLLQEQTTPPEPPAPDDDAPDVDVKPDAAKPTGQQLKAEVLRLHAEGMQSASEIAKATGAARTSVRRWIKARQEEAATSALAGALMPIKAEAVTNR